MRYLGESVQLQGALGCSLLDLVKLLEELRNVLRTPHRNLHLRRFRAENLENLFSELWARVRNHRFCRLNRLSTFVTS